MPGKNIVKQYGAYQYYHAYTRGVAKQKIFLDSQDFQKFISLFKRYLSFEATTPVKHPPYPIYSPRLKLIAYCLMPNHIHLLLFQNDEKAMADFMRSLLTSYSMYFNKKYDRVGPVFQSRYRANLIDKDSYLDHITRYIHLNPSNWQNYPYSSIAYYKDEAHAEWINPAPILEMFPSREQYLEFVRDYEGHKEMLDELQWELADL